MLYREPQRVAFLARVRAHVPELERRLELVDRQRSQLEFHPGDSIAVGISETGVREQAVAVAPRVGAAEPVRSAVDRLGWTLEVHPDRAVERSAAQFVVRMPRHRQEKCPVT